MTTPFTQAQIAPPARPSRPRLVVVTPVFNEQENLARYAETVTRVLFAAPDLDARVILIDDGSTDASWPMMQALAAAEPRFSAVRLSRNYGAHLALAAGFDHAGTDLDAVATLACDLQDPAETVLEFVAAWRAGADIVWGQRRQRGDQGWRRTASHLLESTLRRYAMPKRSRFTTGSFLLLDARVLDCLRRFREQNRVTFALVAWTGFDQATVVYDRAARIAGRSGWGIGQMINTAYDVLIGFSPMPAKMITTAGISLFFVSLFVLAYLVLTWALTNVQPGWTGVMATITICFGVLFMMLGVVAEYLHRIFVETKNRPLYFVSTVAGALPPAAPSGTDPRDGR